jgi:hypothetical protein
MRGRKMTPAQKQSFEVNQMTERWLAEKCSH